LFTAVSRAKKNLFLVGTEEAIRDAATTVQESRNSSLTERLLEISKKFVEPKEEGSSEYSYDSGGDCDDIPF
jgi:hypothetical protein